MPRNHHRRRRALPPSPLLRLSDDVWRYAIVCSHLDDHVDRRSLALACRRWARLIDVAGARDVQTARIEEARRAFTARFVEETVRHAFDGACVDGSVYDSTEARARDGGWRWCRAIASMILPSCFMRAPASAYWHGSTSDSARGGATTMDSRGTTTARSASQPTCLISRARFGVVGGGKAPKGER